MNFWFDRRFVCIYLDRSIYNGIAPDRLLFGKKIPYIDWEICLLLNYYIFDGYAACVGCKTTWKQFSKAESASVSIGRSNLNTRWAFARCLYFFKQFQNSL